MKITKVEAVRFWSERLIRGIAPNWMWVRLHTDKGLAGTGESHPGSDAHRGALSEVAPVMLGEDARKIDRLWQDMSCRIS